MVSQVISKQRVVDHGEVLTAEREVNQMLDLVKQETERIESRFLEPACGNGNFLTAILERKLRVVAARYSRSQLDYERYAVLAVSSVYGIDILEDNVRDCRRRLFDIFDQQYTIRFKKKARERCREAARYILARNIIWGDALTLKTAGDATQPIIFSEWSLTTGSMLKRRDFTFHELLSEKRATKRSLLDEEPLVSDQGEAVFIPDPVRDFPPTHFLEVADVNSPWLQPGRADLFGEFEQ